jgi:hypothetical protein
MCKWGQFNTLGSLSIVTLAHFFAVLLCFTRIIYQQHYKYDISSRSVLNGRVSLGLTKLVSFYAVHSYKLKAFAYFYIFYWTTTHFILAA